MMLPCTWEVGRPWLCSETTVASMPPHSLLLIQYFVLFSQIYLFFALFTIHMYVRWIIHQIQSIDSERLKHSLFLSSGSTTKGGWGNVWRGGLKADDARPCLSYLTHSL